MSLVHLRGGDLPGYIMILACCPRALLVPCYALFYLQCGGMCVLHYFATVISTVYNALPCQYCPVLHGWAVSSVWVRDPPPPPLPALRAHLVTKGQ